MTNTASIARSQNALQKPLPTWITSGVLGMALGGGATFMVLYWYGHHSLETPTSGPPPGATPGGPGMMGGGMMGGGGGGMMGGGMGGGGGGMMGGGGGGSRGKRNLTALVGKLDLAGKGISVQLDSEQSAKLAAQLAELEQPEKMSQEEAQERCDALEDLLTDEQKATLALFELPRAGRGGGGGGMMGGGRPGGMAGGPPGGMPGMGGPPGGDQPDDSNPFQDEGNRDRLRSLLDRLKGAPTEEPSAAEAGTDGS